MALEELQNGRYQRLRMLGSGGMGEVYLMQDMRVTRQVAIKVIRAEGSSYPDSDVARDATRLFQREAKAIAALDHPNILPLYDFGEEILDGTTITYMVMPYAPEGSLAGWLRQSGNTTPLSPHDIAHLVEQAAEALQFAHDHQVIHLDVKPSNFLLRRNAKNPSRPTLLLADFGIARNSATAASSSRTIRGTPTSMAPEQWSSMPVAASDQYALAVMTYELLTGRPPFTGGLEQLMYQHFSAQPPAPSTFNKQLSKDIDLVILRALAKKPEDRYPSISDFASAFTEAAHRPTSQLVFEPQRSDDSSFHATLSISRAEAAFGTSRMITLPGGQQVTVTVPAGVNDGQVIHVREPGESLSTPSALNLAIAIKASDDASPKSVTISAEQTLITPQLDLQQVADPVSDHGLSQATVPDHGPSKTPVSDPNVQAPEKLQTLLKANSGVQLPFDPTSHHDLPTMSAAAPNSQTAEKQQQPALPKRRAPSRMWIIIGATILVILLVLGSTIFLYTNQQTRANALYLAQTATAHTLPPTPTHTPTATPSPTPTPPNGLYIAGTYNGSMVDEITQQTTSISIFLGQNKGSGVLSGTFDFRSPAQGAYPLKGIVDLKGNFSFSVQKSANQTPLYFYGSFQSDYLKGNYCSSSTNSCGASTGYFSAGPRY